jgi:hypothetical protein
LEFLLESEQIKFNNQIKALAASARGFVARLETRPVRALKSFFLGSVCLSSEEERMLVENASNLLLHAFFYFGSAEEEIKLAKLQTQGMNLNPI